MMIRKLSITIARAWRLDHLPQRHAGDAGGHEQIQTTGGVIMPISMLTIMMMPR